MSEPDSFEITDLPIVEIKPEYKKADIGQDCLEASHEFYNQYHLGNDGAIRLGLFDEDLDGAILDPETILISYKSTGNQTRYAPLLVPAYNLEWYNKEMLQKVYGNETVVYCYTHPPVSINDDIDSAILGEVKRVLDEGAVILFDEYEGNTTVSERLAEELGDEYQIEEIGETEDERRVDIFVGRVDIKNDNRVTQAPSIHQVYKAAVESGEILVDEKNGVSIAEIIEGEEAEHIWGIYENPFNELGEADPVYAGFDKEHLLKILADPEIAKIVNRVDGNITTLCFFVQNFDRCPWFNKQYYQAHYPEYFSTGNILIFPGIVSDENLRGNHSQPVINMAVRMLAKRGSDFLVTFECTQISATYIPEIVESVVNDSGVATINGLEDPVSTMFYKAMRKHTNAS